MTARFPTIASVTRDIDEFLDTERWARVRIVSASIPPDADLDDDAAIVRTLFAARFRVSDFIDVFDDSVDLARERRAQ